MDIMKNNTFRHIKNKIYINDREFHEEVLKEFDPNYSLANGWSRHYIQNRKHYITNGKCQMAGGFPWEDGDRYIKSLVEFTHLEKQIELDKETAIDIHIE